VLHEDGDGGWIAYIFLRLVQLLLECKVVAESGFLGNGLHGQHVPFEFLLLVVLLLEQRTVQRASLFEEEVEVKTVYIVDSRMLEKI
jgi:heme/copper-type cytochrome/quinol oxidase subunit 3